MKTDMRDVYLRLKEMQKTVWDDGGDMMMQESLYLLQEQLAELTLRVANECGKTEDLAETFPWIYTRG